MKTTGVWRLPPVAAAALLLMTSIGMAAQPRVAELRPEPASPDRPPEFEWTDVFDVDGKLRLPSWVQRSLRDAVFVEDRISGGTATDISALWHTDNPADSLVYNGPVDAPHDLGNAYVLARVAGIDLMLDVRVERLAGDGAEESYLEIEFNHDVVATTSGHRFPISGTQPGYELRWPFRGHRSDGDLLVRVALDGRQVSSFELARWGEADGIAGYRTLEVAENFGGERCFGNGSFYAACGGPLRADGPGRSYIANGDPEQVYAPDSFVELGINLGYLAELDPDFTTIMVRTPQDIAFGSFRAFGRFSEHEGSIHE